MMDTFVRTNKFFYIQSLLILSVNLRNIHKVLLQLGAETLSKNYMRPKMVHELNFFGDEVTSKRQKEIF